MESLWTAPVPVESLWTALRAPAGREESAPCQPVHRLSTGPQGAPALRACPQAFHTLGLRLETALRSPHGSLPFQSSIIMDLLFFASYSKILTEIK